jgi:serine/threonine-protein kinase
MLARADIEKGRPTMTQESMLARYKILHESCRDATGALYAARERETGAVVALKRIDPAFLSKSGAGFADRILRQARSARTLKHPNIVRVFDAGEVGGTVYVAMEMAEGQTLRGMLDAGPLPIARAIRIARDIACGLAHAHLQAVVHGGLGPSNVIVLRSGAVKITDFGFGLLGQSTPLSPEQARGEPADHRCDIFLLGALFYEMLTGRPPSEGDSPLPSEINEHVPRAVDGIVSRMLAAQPAARIPGAPVVLQELQRLEEALGLESGKSAGTDEPAPMHDAPRPAKVKAGPASEVRVRADAPPAEDHEAFDYHRAIATMERESRRERSSRSRLTIFATLAAALGVLGMGVAGFMYYPPNVGQLSIAASRVQEAPATPPPAAKPTPPPPVAAAPIPIAQAESPVARASEPTAPPGAALTQESPRTLQPPASAAKPQPGGTARLVIAVSPRGEIYIDGKHHGTTPPITTLDLEPGMHRVEVRNGSRKPYLTYMAVQAGDVRRIRHEFDASRSVPPRRTASLRAN